MNIDEEGVNLLRSFAYFCSVILVLAIVSWSSALASADSCDGCTGTCGSDGVCNPGAEKSTDGVNLEELTKLIGADSSKVEKIEVKDGKYIVKYGDKTSVPLSSEQLGQAFGLKSDSKDPTFTIKTKKGDRKIPVKDLPKDLVGIDVDKETGAITYKTKSEGKVVVNNPGVYLQTEKKGKDEFSVLKGYKIGDKEQDVYVTLAKDGEVTIPDKGTINYKGSGTAIKVGESSFQSIDGKTGSLEFSGGPDSFVVKSSKVSSKEFGLNVADGEKGLYFGSGSPPPGMEKRHLTLDPTKKSLTGDLSGLKDSEKIVVANPKTSSSDKLSVDGKLTPGLKPDSKTEVPKESEITFEKDKATGKVVGKVGLGTSATVVSSSTDGKKPNLPDAGTDVKPPSGTNGTNPNNNGTGPGGDGGDGGGDGGGGGGGLPSWLLWALLIGAGILAAMMLLGKKDNKDDGERGDDVEDGGEKYMGKDNATDIHGNVTDDEVNKSLEYNPTEPEGYPCVCNETGCFRCPDDNCYGCTIEEEEPNIQTVESDTNDDLLAANNQTNETDTTNEEDKNS